MRVEYLGVDRCIVFINDKEAKGGTYKGFNGAFVAYVSSGCPEGPPFEKRELHWSPMITPGYWVVTKADYYLLDRILHPDNEFGRVCP